jgi:glycosyltransferase involved in cell wall biosynthesis/mono/diheme cytochrome c family protein
MTRGILVASVLWIASLSVALPRAEAPQSAPPRPASNASSADTLDRSAIDKYCVTCHNQRLKTGGLTLDTPDLVNVAAHPDVWEKVIRKVEAGMMPPAGVPRPDAAMRKALVANLEGVLDRAAKASPSPGRPLVHRLNRAEYANAIRDLLAVDLDVSALLPPDDSSAGFDNNADVLGLSPVLLESYLTAAERISALAVGDPRTPPMGELFRVRQDESQDRHVDGLPIGTVGGLLIQTTLPLDGEYQFQVRLFRTNLGTMRGLEYPHQLEISVNGVRVHLASFGGDKEIASSSDNPTITGDDVDGRFTVRVPLKAGPAKIGVAFLEKTHALNTRRLQSYVRSSADTIDFSGNPHIDEVILTGPFKVTGVGDTPSRRRIFVCQPKGAAEEQTCAQRILTMLARRAYRGDVAKEDVPTLMDFYQRGRSDGGSFDSGIDLAMRRLLASPKFLVRTLAIIPKSIAIARAAEQERVDHIHAHFATHATTAAYIVHRLTGIPFSFTAHAYDIYVDRHMLREKARLAHSIVVVSETNRRLMVDCCGSEIESKLNVVRNGVDSDRFAAGNEHVQRDCLQVLCVGGLEAKKGQQHLIEACRILKQRGIALRCIVIGDGPLRLQLERQIHEADVADAVELIGGQPHTVVAEHMRAADIVALPSVVTTTGKTEGLPVVLTEALACERAVVATRVAGVLELVIDGETGLLVAPGDAQALADALERLHRDPTLRRRLGQAGRLTVVSEYDPSRNVARLRALFATPDR